MMNGYLIFVVALILLGYLMDLVVDVLNLGHVKTEIPAEFEGWYDAEKYRKAQRYLRDTTRFGILNSCVLTPLGLAFILIGGFGWVDTLARSWGQDSMVWAGLVFAGLLAILFRRVVLLGATVVAAGVLAGLALGVDLDKWSTDMQYRGEQVV